MIKKHMNYRLVLPSHIQFKVTLLPSLACHYGSVTMHLFFFVNGRRKEVENL
jgi:hypothetical protein